MILQDSEPQLHLTTLFQIGALNKQEVITLGDPHMITNILFLQFSYSSE